MFHLLKYFKNAKNCLYKRDFGQCLIEKLLYPMTVLYTDSLSSA